MSGKSMPTSVPAAPRTNSDAHEQEEIGADASAEASPAGSPSLAAAQPATAPPAAESLAAAPTASGTSAPTPAPASSPSSAPSLPSLSNLSTFQSLLDSHAHYGTDLWDSVPSVAAQSEASKATLARLCRFMKDKAELDKEYAKSLKKITLKMQIPDVPRVADIPTPPQAAAQAAQAAVAGSDSGSSSIRSGSDGAASSSSTVGGSASSASASAPPVDPRSFDRFLMAFRNLHLTLATNLEILSAKIIEQVSKPLAMQRDTHATQSKRIMGELDKYTQGYQRHLEALLATRAACQKACLESEAMRRKLEHAQANASASGHSGSSGASNALQELVGSFKADSASLVRRALLADAKYIQSVKSMRGFRVSSDATLAHLLDQCEGLENSKLTDSLATITHYLAITSQMFASNTKNLQAVQNVGDKVNPHTDLQFFILCHRSGKPPLGLPEYQVFQGHPNYSRAVQEEESGSGAGGDGGKGGAQGDLSSISSAQMGDGGEAGEGAVASSTAGAPISASPPVFTKSKSSGWGWLNSLAAVLPGTNASKAAIRAGAIDHDVESVLTRGSNFYEQQAQMMQMQPTRTGSATATASGSSAPSSSDPDYDALDDLTPSPAPARRGGSFSGDGYGDGDEAAEEKSPERVAMEAELGSMFSAITGRVSVPISPSPAGSASPSSSSSTSAAAPSASSSGDTSSPPLDRDLTPAELARSQSIFSTPEGRKSFASVLNRQRNTSGGLKLPSMAALKRLAGWTRKFLDQARESMHVNPTQLVMIMSQSFFVEEDAVPSSSAADPASSSSDPSDPSDESGAPRSPPRTYLLSLIRSHPLWLDMRFWEEAFFDAYNSKIAKSAAARVRKWHSDLEQAEGVHTRKQVCFSTLSTFAHNMSEFGMRPRSIVDFVEKLGSIHELDEDHLDMLRSMHVYAEQRAADARARRNSNAIMHQRVPSGEDLLVAGAGGGEGASSNGGGRLSPTAHSDAEDDGDGYEASSQVSRSQRSRSRSAADMQDPHDGEQPPSRKATDRSEEEANLP